MQRQYVWHSTRVRDLDSLYRGYPSGAIPRLAEDGDRGPTASLRKERGPGVITRDPLRSLIAKLLLLSGNLASLLLRARLGLGKCPTTGLLVSTFADPL